MLTEDVFKDVQRSQEITNPSLNMGGPFFLVLSVAFYQSTTADCNAHTSYRAKNKDNQGQITCYIKQPTGETTSSGTVAAKM